MCAVSFFSPCFIASSSYFSLCSRTPFNDATLLPPPVSRRIRHFWFQHLYIAQRKRTKKGVSAMKDTSSSTVPPPVRDRTSPLPISTAGTVPVASGPSAIITSSASTAPSNRDGTSPSTGRIVWAGTSVPSASATSADWTRKAAPPTHGQMHNALPSSDW